MSFTLDLVYDDQQPNRWSLWQPTIMGVLAIATTIVAFLFWSTLVPLASAVFASGVVVTDGSNKVIQSVELGSVSKIDVKDGDFVLENQPLITLNGAQQASSISALEREICSNHAQQSRLRAELADNTVVTFPDYVHGIRLARFRDLLEDENRELKIKRTALNFRSEELQNEKQALNASIAGLDRQVQTLQTRQLLVRQNVATAVAMSDSGIGSKRSVRDAISESATLSGELADFASRKADLFFQVARSDIEIRRLVASAKEADSAELQKLIAEEQELFERLDQTRISLGRTILRSPVSGEVMNLAVHTIGGVILPGAPLLEVVPRNAPLVIEAKIRPVDVNDLKVGSSVIIKVDGSEFQKSSDINGQLTSITADRLTDRETEDGFFLARISVSRAQIRTHQGVELRPGVPMTLVIVKKRRSLASYLLDPMIEGLSPSLRE